MTVKLPRPICFGARAWMSWRRNPGKPGRKRAFCSSSRTVLAQLGDPDRDVLLTLAKKLATR